MSAPALLLRGVHKSYRSGFLGRPRPVLAGVDLTLPSGAALLLAGPNGSGKTTLLRLAAGVELPSAGDVLTFGVPPAKPSARARIGYQPESDPWPRELSAPKVLELVAAVHGIGRRIRRARAHELASRVGLAGRRPVATFSRGMLRRLGIAAAFLADPDLVLLDEPTSGLDAPGHALFEELLGEARRRGASVLLSSHHLGGLLEHADELAFLVEGAVAARGSPEEIVPLSEQARLEVRGLDREGIEGLAPLVRGAGGELVSSGPSDRALEALYRQVASRRRR